MCAYLAWLLAVSMIEAAHEGVDRSLSTPLRRRFTNTEASTCAVPSVGAVRVELGVSAVERILMHFGYAPSALPPLVFSPDCLVDMVIFVTKKFDKFDFLH